jgi:hypothetical protein
MNSYIYVANTLGSPSALTIRNFNNFINFDNNLKYAYDCEAYYRIYKLYGNPKIINDITVFNLLWENSVTSNVSQKLINEENNYILRKHNLS